jgi:serine/threonine protein kinase
MELAENSLAGVLNNNRKYPEAEAKFIYLRKLNIMEQCYQIILTFHKAEFFHRDIKPAQFLLF